jgi:hypothetical protein
MTGVYIICDFVTLVDLYNIATVLEDPYVHELVMACWQSMLHTDIEVELDAQLLDRLFTNTQTGHSAQPFWATALYSESLAEMIIGAGDYHDTLIMMLKELTTSQTLPLPHVLLE